MENKEARPRYDAGALIRFATELLTRAGMPADRAAEIADILVDADLLGHDTHGLQLLAPYLGEIEGGQMTLTGEPALIADHGAAVTWDGQRLPGIWLVLRAMELATARARQYGTGTVVIRRSHHIACLASFLERAASQGLVMLLLTSDRNSGSVAPYGGLTPVFTPNPIAAGFPSGRGKPVLVDVSTSITTNGLTNRLYREGKTLPHPWVMDNQGTPSNDPAVLFTDPPGSLLPVGGMDAGHKGYGLGLTVEALTGGLAGSGRADPREGWGATVFVQILDPEMFSGLAAFEKQMGWLADACHASAPRPGFDRVRLPGEGGAERKQKQRDLGVALHPGIMPGLLPWAEKLGVPAPQAK